MYGRQQFLIISATAANLLGKSISLVCACLFVAAWIVIGRPFADGNSLDDQFSTAATIITFLMVFILQGSQNRDGIALQAKLNELILNSEAKNRLIGAETFDEDDLQRLNAELQREADEAAVATTDDVTPQDGGERIRP